MLAVLVVAVPVRAQTPWRIGLAAGPLIFPNTENGALGPMAAIAVGRRVGSRLLIQAVVEGAPLVAMSQGDDVTTFGPCPGCGVIIDSPREPHLALAGSMEARLFDHAGERGGYATLGVGFARYSAEGGYGSRVSPRAHFSIGGALSAAPGSLFMEARVARTFDTGPYPTWGLGLLLGWRFAP